MQKENQQLEPNWGDLYAELRNKMRWAIGSTVAESGLINLGFRSQVAMAGPLAQEALEKIQAIYEKPNLQIVGERIEEPRLTA